MSIDNNIEITKISYLKYKKDLLDLLDSISNSDTEQMAKKIFYEEKKFLNLSNIGKLKIAIYKLHSLGFLTLNSDFKYVTNIFYNIIENKVLIVDQNKANYLINDGNKCIKKQHTAKLIAVIRRLYELIPEDDQSSKKISLPIGII